jgi:hypothetical protein
MKQKPIQLDRSKLLGFKLSPLNPAENTGKIPQAKLGDKLGAKLGGKPGVKSGLKPT